MTYYSTSVKKTAIPGPTMKSVVQTIKGGINVTQG